MYEGVIGGEPLRRERQVGGWDLCLEAGVESGRVSALGHTRSWIFDSHDISDRLYLSGSCAGSRRKREAEGDNAPKSWAEVRQYLGVSLGSRDHSPQLSESTPPVSKTPTFQYNV